MARMCPTCLMLVPAHQWVEHQDAHANGVRPSAGARRNAAAYRELESRWAPLVRRGIVHCRRGEACLLVSRPEGSLITRGEDWVLSHDDYRRNFAPAPEHAQCYAARTASRVSALGARQAA
jgi:hypothetical protein